MSRSRMMEAMDREMMEFFGVIEKKYDLPEGEIWSKWMMTQAEEAMVIDPGNEETSGMMKKKKKSGVEGGRKSNYQVFFSLERERLMKEHPEMSFGEVSKRVSQMWKDIPMDARRKYETEKRGETLQDLNIKNLRQRCKELGIPGNGRKESLIEMIRKRENEGRLSTQKEKESVTIVQHAKTSSRTKLELSIEDKKEEEEEDEEDFYFQEELEETDREDEDGILDDDEGEEQDDEDMFAEDD